MYAKNKYAARGAVGKWLRQVREENSFSAAEFGRFIHITPTHVLGIEAGKRYKIDPLVKKLLAAGIIIPQDVLDGNENFDLSSIPNLSSKPLRTSLPCMQGVTVCYAGKSCYKENCPKRPAEYKAAASYPLTTAQVLLSTDKARVAARQARSFGE